MSNFSKLPDLFITKKDWHIKRDPLTSKQNTFSKTTNNFGLKNSSKKSKIKENEKNDNEFDEQSLLKQIEELTNELESKENLFTYNQKKYQKNLEEKEDKIINLENQIKKLKDENKYNEEKLENDFNTKYINSFKELNKQLEIKNLKIEELEHDLKNSNEKYEELLNKNEKIENELKLLKENYNKFFTENPQIQLDEELKNFVRNLNDKIIEQENYINNLNNEINYINIENKKLRNLSKQIIEQRNEIEIFFLDALEQVKKELFIKKKEIEKRGNFFPTLKKNFKDFKIKVDIRTITPEMREKIFRNIFEKINKSYDPKKYEELNNIISADLEEN